jgi:methyl-accepting chemotaxis protein
VDYEGKPIGKLSSKPLKMKWLGGIHGPKPGETTPSLKLTYIKRAQYQDQTYLVGSGVYI